MTHIADTRTESEVHINKVIQKLRLIGNIFSHEREKCGKLTDGWTDRRRPGEISPYHNSDGPIKFDTEFKSRTLFNYLQGP